MKIFALSEGVYTVDGTKQFAPYNPDTDTLQSRPGGSLLVNIVPFLVVTKQDIILLDAGLGFTTAEGTLQLIKNIENYGYKATEVTKVLMSHLHRDHTGGMMIKGKPAFENAMYYINRAEYDNALEKTSSSYHTIFFENLPKEKIVWLQQEEGIINDNISYRVTHAHSAFHTVFWIKEDGETVFYGADDAPQLQQMKHRFAAKYDYNGALARDLRTEWWEKGNNEKWVFLFYHDPATPVYKADA